MSAAMLGDEAKRNVSTLEKDDENAIVDVPRRIVKALDASAAI